MSILILAYFLCPTTCLQEQSNDKVSLGMFAPYIRHTKIQSDPRLEQEKCSNKTHEFTLTTGMHIFVDDKFNLNDSRCFYLYM